MFYWIALNFVQGIGSVKYKALISHFKSPENVFKADIGELLRVDGIGEKLADSIKSFSDFKAVEAEMGRAEEKNVNIVMYPDYPVALKNVHDSPPLLYVKGSIDDKDDNAFSIVGARKAAIENIAFAEDIAYKLSKNGVTVVSGMAAGIDSAAHRGALKAGGRTIAVLGSGVDVVYPFANKELYEDIFLSGAVISEFRLGTPPNKENFPKRNRIISGLGKGLLVVEANTDSGSLITADFAVRQNKKLFAVPGDIRREKAKGTNNLIKKGALLVDSADDIFDNMRFSDNVKRTDANVHSGDLVKIRDEMSDNEFTVYEVIKDKAVHIDDIIKKSSLEASVVSGSLLNLELKGYIKQFSGKMFVKVD